MKIQLYRF